MDYKRITRFFYEMGTLQRMPRTGHIYLGSGTATVAEHVFRTAMIGYTLALIEGADCGKVLLMCQFHDVEEARTGDLNYLQQRYVNSDDKKALKHTLEGLPFENDIHALIDEYRSLETKEALVAKDADALELACLLKEELDKGNKQAGVWLENVKERIKTDGAKKLYQEICDTEYYDWWYGGHDWSNGSKSW